MHEVEVGDKDDDEPEGENEEQITGWGCVYKTIQYDEEGKVDGESESQRETDGGV